MYARPSWRRATGELAIDPALHQLVMHTGALLDRLIRSRGMPIPEAPAPARGDPARTPAAASAPGGDTRREPLVVEDQSRGRPAVASPNAGTGRHPR